MRENLHKSFQLSVVVDLAHFSSPNSRAKQLRGISKASEETSHIKRGLGAMLIDQSEKIPGPRLIEPATTLSPCFSGNGGSLGSSGRTLTLFRGLFPIQPCQPFQIRHALKTRVFG